MHANTPLHYLIHFLLNASHKLKNSGYFAPRIGSNDIFPDCAAEISYLLVLHSSLSVSGWHMHARTRTLTLTTSSPKSTPPPSQSISVPDEGNQWMRLAAGRRSGCYFQIKLRWVYQFIHPKGEARSVLVRVTEERLRFPWGSWNRWGRGENGWRIITTKSGK